MKNLRFMFAFIATIAGIACFAGFAGFCSPPSEAVQLEQPDISAESAIIMDADTGKVIFSKNGYEIRAMASLTKVMTTLLTLEAGDLDRKFTVDNDAIHVEGSSMGLRENDTVTRRDLCYGMMLPSGNDAANAAAVSVAGSLWEFSDMMNQRAELIGMEDTHFANPHGLDENGHVSTAYDMALMTADALKIPGFREICSSKSVRLEFGDPPYKRSLANNNKMLWSYDGCFGVKTGFTDDAGRCLISAAEKDGKTLIVVTLNASDDWQDHIKMFDYGFEIVKYEEIEYNQVENAQATAAPITTEAPITTQIQVTSAVPSNNAKIK